MIRIRLLPGLALLSTLIGGSAIPGVTAGASWQLVESRSRAQTEIDVASIVRKDGHASGWIQTTYTNLTSSESGTYFAYRSLKENLRMHCADRTASVLARAYFNDEGTEIAMIKGKGEARPVAPDTTEQRVLQRMCNPTAAAANPARIDAAKRAAGAPVAPIVPAATLAAGKPATTDAVSARYMDGPARTEIQNGFIKTKAESGNTRPSAVPASGEPVAEKPAEKAIASGPTHDSQTAKSGAVPASDKATGTVSATAPPPARMSAKDSQESRRKIVARVLRERSPAEPALNGHSHSRPEVSGAHQHMHWAYEGENAPYRWGDMKADYATCKSGSRQSPIDIRNPVVSDIEPIQFHYEDAPLRVSNNGHTIEVGYPPGSFMLHAGARYELIGFHFHTPSEERINGRTFDMVAHLVHKSAQGKLAVIAVLLTAGREQAMLQQIWNAMPGSAGRTRERLDVMINAKHLLPADPAFYSYMGSLTTPPCTEGVQWLVMKTPVEMSRDQIGHFTALYPMNARPLQAHNDRLIKSGK